MMEGNQQKMREALVEISKTADDWEPIAVTKAGALDRIYELANAALSAPVPTTEKSSAVGNATAIRKALDKAHRVLHCAIIAGILRGDDAYDAMNMAAAALSEPPRTGKWENGRKYEYEYAYCSACGHMQWAGWDSHREAEDNVESFADNYRFCPGCGVRMEGGVYVK